MRQRISKKKSKRIFSKTAVSHKALNVPGKVVQRGGVRL